MTKKQHLQRYRLTGQLTGIGFTENEAQSLIRIEMTLHRWAEHECNGNIQRDGDDGTGKPRWCYSGGGKGYLIADRERGALRRAEKIIAARNARVPHSADRVSDDEVSFYHQGDPRGAALYIIRPGDVRGGEDVSSVYNRGICVCGR